MSFLFPASKKSGPEVARYVLLRNDIARFSREVMESLRSVQSAKDLWEILFSASRKDQNHSLLVCAAVLLVLLGIVLPICILIRQRRQQKRILGSRRLRVPALDTFAAIEQQQQAIQMARTRSRTDDSWNPQQARDLASILSRRHLFAASRYQSSGGGSFLQRPTRERSQSFEQSSRGARPRNSNHHDSLQTSADSYRDSDLLAEEVQWVAEELMEQMLEYEDRQHDPLFSPRSRSRSGNAPPQPSSSATKLLLRQGLTASPLRRLGPKVHQISYRTVTPPPTWAEASRHLVLYDTAAAWKLSRDVALQLTTTAAAAGGEAATTFLHHNKTTQEDYPIGTATLVIQEVPNTTHNSSNNPESSSFFSETAADTSQQQYHRRKQQRQIRKVERKAFRRPVTDCSIRVKRPVEGGVLELYEKQTAHGDEAAWVMEHTFHTAVEAAQFQLDFLALQMIGPGACIRVCHCRIFVQGCWKRHLFCCCALPSLSLCLTPVSLATRTYTFDSLAQHVPGVGDPSPGEYGI